MAPAQPTRRELVLVLVLLLTILYYSSSRVQNYPFPAPVSPLSLHHSSAFSTLEEKTPLVYDTRLTWGNDDVPQTKVLANVPGNYMPIFS